jgi:hypothetical protein
MRSGQGFDVFVVQRPGWQRLTAPEDHDTAQLAEIWKTEMDVAALAELLHETVGHGSSEAVAPPHDWWDWDAAHMDAALPCGSSDRLSPWQIAETKSSSSAHSSARPRRPRCPTGP